jgi:hypothetical protein
MRTRKLPTLLATGGLVLGIAAAPATADPKKGELVPLDCDNGQTYSAYVNGNGEFTPAHDADSNSMLIPTSFGEFHGTVTDSQGNVVDEFTEPGAAKGKSASGKKDLITCEFSFEGTEDGLTFKGGGTVTGFITPSKG